MTTIHERDDWRPNDPPSPMIVRAADRLYAECERAIREGRLDARNPIADAALDYREERDQMARRALRERSSTTEDEYGYFDREET